MRLFIGIPLEEKLLNEINSLCRKFKNLRKIKLVNKENFHITLKFIGEVDESVVQDIKDAMDDAFKGEKVFFISTNKISAFPSEKKAKVIWFNINKNSERIINLFYKLEENLFKKNFAKEHKSYIPHITVARIKESQDISEIVNALDFEFKTKIENIVLYQSILRTEGSIYKKIYEKNFIQE